MDSYQLKWHSHSNHLNCSVASLLRSERFTDVVLCTLDGCQIPAHKFILNSCSIYLSHLFDSQRSSLRLGNSMIYVILPAEITTKALQILIEYMYKGETTVSNDVLDTVLKAGDLLKIRGLWRQSEDKNEKPADKIVNDKASETTSRILPPKPTSEIVFRTQTKQSEIISKLQQSKAIDSVTRVQTDVINKSHQTEVINKSNQNIKTDDVPRPKISVKNDDKLLKTYTPLQHINISRQSIISPPKLVFIKTSDPNSSLRSLTTPQTIIVQPDIPPLCESQEVKTISNQGYTELKSNFKKSEKKYTKKVKIDHPKKQNQKGIGEIEESPLGEYQTKSVIAIKEEIVEKDVNDINIKEEPNWDNDEGMDESIFHSEITIKPEFDKLVQEMEEDEMMFSPLTCELCLEVFHIPGEWVRHIQTHAESNAQPRKRKARSASDDTEESTALLRCDLCQKLFPNPAEWVRHIQNTHTETELALSNNSSPPRRHNRYIYGDQKKTCDHCKKIFPSHASMVIHLRTHTGERPFVCGLCNKGFNVKSNLLRHLRTLHDTIVSPGIVPLLQDEIVLSSPETSSNTSTSTKQNSNSKGSS